MTQLGLTDLSGLCVGGKKPGRKQIDVFGFIFENCQYTRNGCSKISCEAVTVSGFPALGPYLLTIIHLAYLNNNSYDS